MFATAQLGSVAFSLAAVMLWGTSDFLGGYATRRANAFVFTSIVNMGGLVLVGGLATASRIPLPSAHVVLWAVAGGVSGGASLAIFYRALSSSRMGLSAPIAAVLSAAIPALVAMISQGLPGTIAILGFGLAGVGLWLITRTEGDTTPEGIELAIVAGIGFAGFYLCVHQAGDGSALWVAI